MEKLRLMLFLVTIAGRNEANGNKQPKGEQEYQDKRLPMGHSLPVCLSAYLLVCLSACLPIGSNFSAYLLSPVCLSAQTYLLSCFCQSAYLLEFCLSAHASLLICLRQLAFIHTLTYHTYSMW